MLPNNFEAFLETITLAKPPIHWPNALKSAWYDAKGDWEASHNIAQDMQDTMGSWLHAYLHRKEGDKFNAGYWYRQAGKKFPTTSLDTELQVIVEFIIANYSE